MLREQPETAGFHLWFQAGKNIAAKLINHQQYDQPGTLALALRHLAVKECRTSKQLH